MNRGVSRSSPVQQMTSTTGGNPNYWWSMNNNIIKPPLPPPHHSNITTTSFSAPLPPPLPPPLDHYTPPVPTPPYFSNLWVDNIQELPPESISWSQLLLGGLVDENEKSDLSNILQRKKLGMENWEEPNSNGSLSDDVTQEYSTKNYMYYYGNDHDDGRVAAVAKSSNWMPMPPEAAAVSPPTSSCITTLKSNKFSGNNLDGSRRPLLDHSSECNSIGATAGKPKKARVQPSTQSAFKVRKEKLGDRITALHQLVSPFGKTDTASVLLETIGYIKCLHTQIQALSVPYLGNTSGKTRLQDQQQNDCYEEPKKDLKSIGLCLVPTSSTLQVGNYNGADYWVPALSGGVGGGFR